MRLKSICIAAGLAMAVTAPAVAQQTQTVIEVPATASWKHAQTGVILRPSLLGVPRTKIIDNSQSELDVMVQYDQEGPTVATVYIFKPSLPSVPVWFDRSETQIMVRDVYANPTPQGPAAAFAPPRGKATSGLRRIYVPGKGPYKATALAIMPLGEWLVAIRISSKEFDAPTLDAKLNELIGAIGWPEGITDSQNAVAVAGCGAPLSYAKNAKMTAPSMGDALFGSVLATVTPDDAQKADAKPVTWCREGQPTAQYAVYRAVGIDSGYMVAMGDAGITIDVARGFALDKKDPGYRLTLGMLDRSLIYPSFDKLPTPDAAIAGVMKGTPIASTQRGSKNITINSATVDKK